MLSACATTVDRDHRELLRHGTAAFPVGCYHDDLHQADVIWHWHEELEAGLVTQGSALVTIGSRTEHLRTGDAFFINTGVLHAARPGQAGPCRLHSLVFHPRLVGGSPESVFYQDYLLPLTARPEQQNLVLRAEAPGCGPVAAAIEAAWQACAQEPPHFVFAVRAALSDLVALLHDDLARAPAAGIDRRALRDAERIKAMLGCVHSRYAEPLTVADIARSAALSPSECLRCFRRTVGRTPTRYLRDVRLRQTAALLAGTGMPVAEVAARCGFDDVSYFTRTFRAQRQLTPTAFRQASRAGTGETAP